MSDPEVKIVVNAVDQASSKLKGITGSFTEFNSALGLVGKAADVVKKVYAETVDVAYEYNLSMKKLAQTLDIGVEETSRLTQAADDLGVSQEKSTQVMQFMSKMGIAPTIENIANLSDHLLSITDVTERNKEATKLLGRSWFEAAPFILAGGDAIRKAAAAQSGALVVTDEAIKATEEWRVTQDEFNDTVEEAKIAIGNGLIPVVNDLLKTLMGTNDAYTEANALIEAGTAKTLEQALAIITQRKAINDATTAHINSEHAVGTEARAVEKLTTDVSKYITTARLGITAQDALNFSLQEGDKKMQELAFTMGGPLTDENDRFAQSQEDLRKQADELKLKIDELRKKKWLGKEGKEQLEEYKGKLDEVKGQIEENAKAHDLATKKILWDLLQQKLAVNGVTDAEAIQLMTVGNAWGLIDDTAVKMWDANSKLVGLLEDKKITVDDYAKAMAIAAENGWDWAKALAQIGVNIKSIPKNTDVNINFKYKYTKIGAEPGPGVPIPVGPPDAGPKPGKPGSQTPGMAPIVTITNYNTINDKSAVQSLVQAQFQQARLKLLNSRM